MADSKHDGENAALDSPGLVRKRVNDEDLDKQSTTPTKKADVVELEFELGGTFQSNILKRSAHPSGPNGRITAVHDDEIIYISSDEDQNEEADSEEEISVPDSRKEIVSIRVLGTYTISDFDSDDEKTIIIGNRSPMTISDSDSERTIIIGNLHNETTDFHNTDYEYITDDELDTAADQISPCPLIEFEPSQTFHGTFFEELMANEALIRDDTAVGDSDLKTTAVGNLRNGTRAFRDTDYITDDEFDTAAEQKSPWSDIEFEPSQTFLSPLSEELLLDADEAPRQG